MVEVLRILVKNCKLAVQQDGLKLRLTADGPLAVAAAVIIMILFVSLF